MIIVRENKVNVKASAKAKLVAGEPLTEEEAELDCGPNCDKSILSKIGPL